MKNIKIEVENQELALKNSYGDIVIIPKDKREEIKKMLANNCHSCIDSFVDTLPNMEDYAEDGSVYPTGGTVSIQKEDKTVSTMSTDSKEYKDLYNSGKLLNYDEKSDSYAATPLKEIEITAEAPQWLKDKKKYESQYSKDWYIDNLMPDFSRSLGISSNAMGSDDIKKYNNYINDKVVKDMFKRNPTFDVDYSNDRLKTLQKFSHKELELIKNSNYAHKIEPSIWSKFEQGLLSLGNVGSPIQVKNENLTKEEIKKEDNPLNILQPLLIPPKIAQSAYKDNYSLKDAIKGKQNNASIAEDIIIDPLNLIGLGIWGELSKVGKFAKIEDAYQAVKGLNKEEVIQKLSDLPKLKEIPLNYDMENLIKGISTTDKKNMEILKKGSEYFKELSTPESLKRLKEFEKEYDIDLLDAYKKAKKRWDSGINIGKNDRFQIAGNEIFKNDVKDAMGISTANADDVVKNFLTKDKNAKKDLSDISINYINKKTNIEDYSTVIWHELSHDINKNIIGNSSKLKKDIEDIFISDLSTLSDDVIINAKNKSEKLYASDFAENLSNNKTVSEMANDEFNYVTKPTEVWAFLSTNLRQDLKKTELITEYNQTLTPEILNQAIENGNTIFSRFAPYIKDKDKFITLFNKMTLSIAPAAIYLQQNNSTKK